MSYHAVAALTVAFSLALGVIQEPVPAAMPVGADCARHVATHTLIRNDVLARLDAADQNLPKAEAALAQSAPTGMAAGTTSSKRKKPCWSSTSGSWNRL